MSLTSDIATLVARSDSLIDTFDKKSARIDAAVADAIAAVPILVKKIYLDQVNGSDANGGTTPETAVQSFDRVFALSGDGRAVDIMLMSDYAFGERRVALPVAAQVAISSYDPNNTETTFRLRPGFLKSSLSGKWQMAAFYSPRFGVTTLVLNRIELVFPATPAVDEVDSDRYNGFLSSNHTNGSVFVGVELNVCKLTRPAGSAGVVVGADTRAAALFVKSCTWSGDEMKGRWVAGVAAGTTPASTGRVLSNLATL